MNKVKDYIENNKERWLHELFEFIRIPSVSAQKQHAPDMEKAAVWLKARLMKAGADKAEVLPTGGHPVVYGEKIINKKLPAVLVYGHYDVQPPEPLELWNTPPFEPVIIKNDIHPEGAVFARGANDDKGQSYMHIAAFEYLMQSKDLPCNVKFLFEGEEEIGSANLDKFLEKHGQMLASDVVLVSDTTMISKEQPSVMTGLRGLCYFEIELEGPNRDLHSGHFGGAVFNPVNELCKMIAKLHDKDYRITIPGFYDDVYELSREERHELSLNPFSMEDYKNNLGLDEVCGEKGYTAKERSSIRPALDVNGIWGGYTGEGAKTIIPSKAFAKISIRLVPNQNPDKVSVQFMDYFKTLAPKGTRVKISLGHGAFPYFTPSDGKAYKAALAALERVYGKKALPVRGGGSIGVVPMFEKFLGIKTILLGFGLDTDVIHSPNENYSLQNFCRGIESIIYFYEEFVT